MLIDHTTIEDQTMNRSELIESLAVKKTIPIKQAKEVVTAVFASMTDALLSGDRIEIRGFGSFCVRNYDGYTGRNPKSGEHITVKAKRLPYFKVGKDLKEKVLG